MTAKHGECDACKKQSSLVRFLDGGGDEVWVCQECSRKKDLQRWYMLSFPHLAVA